MRPATLKQCVIFAGELVAGMDTDPLDPRPLPVIGGKPFLTWLMREALRFGVEDFWLLAPDLSDWARNQLERAADALPKNVRFSIATHGLGVGTSGALLALGERLAPRFLLCGGHLLFDGNLARLLADFARDGEAVLCRQLLREGGGPVGIYACDKGVLGHLTGSHSLEEDLAGKVGLVSTTVPGWFADLSTAEGLRHAANEARYCFDRPALFLDRDGVVNIDHGYVGSRERWEWVPGALEAVALAADHGWHVFIVTNQAGVAHGLYGEPDVAELLDWVADQFRLAGGTLDDFRYCPYHAEAKLIGYRRDHDWRKPAPGMLVDLLRAWEIDPRRCLMVGDRDIDMEAAKGAGVKGALFPGGNLLEFIKPYLQR